MYLIDEEELTEKIMKVFDEDGWILLEEHAEKIKDMFLKDKQPVEEIASGRVSEINLDSCIVGKENDYVKFDDLFRYLQGKNIKIYIEVKE